ncbi:DEAD/DEAH box helicase [Actinoalloteichus fjordicus]|uniref:DNA/RNA helicase, superfamily II n=1 Tax=Actinoalloteichus fjordicus TaxID=1612552 RepID=A0AAC9LAI4_9PSEU|nr:DEAD/DEAH box helicase family protein [Actinoalloteichus fjordicus]APU13082.1 DNA/RNA helicase, superfamily II [Actinoalloteichus fjordicus]
MSWVPFNCALVEEIKARMNLREPNADALAAVAKEIEEGNGREVVCDLATGVGKTYLAAALVEYIAVQGVRNVLIVTPGTTIQSKTVGNFTPGHPKFVPHAEHQPLLITSVNYSRGQVGDALHSNDVLKLFVFNVQQLIRPTANTSRKLRQDDEFVGGPLYEHLRSVNDLVVIADEHHVYRTNAKAFASAIRDLSPRALVGLTATPDEADGDKVIFTYSLAEAIADGLVKIPVIVYREDGIKDIETQLADACHLRDRKEAVWRTWAETNNLTQIAPVLFVVCQEIRDAEKVATILRGDSYLPGEGRVLVITSQSDDDALKDLADVESPDSPVRAVVSVDKLKEGWDVKNIGVIVGYRALASQTLTEQVLGRGLRLPFGKRVGVPAIDQVDLVAHDSYRKLLAQKDALLQRVVPPESGPKLAPTPGSVPTPPVSSGASPPDLSGVQEAETQGILHLIGPERVINGERVDGSDVLQIASFEATTAQHQHDHHAVTKILDRVDGAPLIKFPRREREVLPIQFSLSYVQNSAARAEGAAFQTEFPVYLKRQALLVERDVAGQTVVRAQQVEEEDAVQQYMPVWDVRRNIENRILDLGLVEASFPELNAAERIAKQFLLGAGVADEDDEALWSERRTHQAVSAIAKLVEAAYNARRLNPHWGWRTVEVPVRRPMPSDTGSKWDETFSKDRWYGGWGKSIQPAVNFDAKSTEFKLAHLFDGSKSVVWWLRLYEPGDAYIELENGKRYYPDFVVLDTEGVYWVIEGKADRDAGRDDVLNKKRIAEEWAQFARDRGEFGVWRYMFAGESNIKKAGSWEELLALTKPE